MTVKTRYRTWFDGREEEPTGVIETQEAPDMRDENDYERLQHVAEGDVLIPGLAMVAAPEAI